MNSKILIGSPIRQKPAILVEFLNSVKALDLAGFEVDCLFIDNNDDYLATELLNGFKPLRGKVIVSKANPELTYECADDTHHWNEQLIWKVAAYKDWILDYAIEHGYSHVFLVDSDLVLHPQTLQQLISTDKNIVSEIFWTKWTPDLPPLPQVWCTGQYSFYYGTHNLPEEVKNNQAAAFLNSLETPGLYQVGGLGACTLIKVCALRTGLRFTPISNLDYWGEDRHFCIRASVLGFDLYVDTHYPALHLYRESDLHKVPAFKAAAKQKLTLGMIVRNEAKRYLPQVLEQVKTYIDRAVILDDASTDDTVAVCRRLLADIPHQIISLPQSMFATEYQLREQLWQETIKTGPQWILCLDADEILDPNAVNQIQALLQQSDLDVLALPIYDFWSETHYREDEHWQAHKHYYPFIVRYRPELDYHFLKTAQHCGRFPQEVLQQATACVNLRVKHLGWAKAEDRLAKYHRYQELDPKARYGNRAQYESILDPNPNLIPWQDRTN